MDVKKARPHIVILGGGFGGLYTYHYLNKFLRSIPHVRITLVSEQNYFLFTPLLHEVATGGLSPSSVVAPVRSVLSLRTSDFCKAKVKRISLTAKKIEMSVGELSYDYLVLALGSETNFCDVPGASEHSFGLKSLADAATLKNHILECFESAAYSMEANRSALGTIVVIGGGPTGVELVGELAEFVHYTLVPTYSDERCAQPRIILLDQANELMAKFDPRIRQNAARVLTAHGVELRLGVSVAEVSKSGVLLKSGEHISARTVIWTAGIKPRTPKLAPSTILDEHGRVPVDALLRVRGYEDVFALGDLAAVTDAHGVRVPDLAQSATKEAKIAAENIASAITGRKQRVFTWRPTGVLVSLGRWKAVGIVRGIYVSGPLAWCMWRAVYLFKMLTWQKQVKVALEWAVNIFSRRDVSEL